MFRKIGLPQFLGRVRDSEEGATMDIISQPLWINDDF